MKLIFSPLKIAKPKRPGNKRKRPGIHGVEQHRRQHFTLTNERTKEGTTIKMINCPNCNCIIIKALSRDEAKLRAVVVIFKDNKVCAVCRCCKSKVSVSVRLTVSPLETYRLVNVFKLV